jgi:hypothetical protein
MFQAGLLKIAMKLRSEKKKDFEGYLNDVMKELRLDPKSFRHYVNSNMQTVMATLKVGSR